MKKLLAPLIPVLAILAMNIPSHAALTWCKSDPIVLLGGTQVQVLVGVADGYTQYVNGPVQVTIYDPKPIPDVLTFADSGFNGYGETVRFYNSGGNSNPFPANFQVTVPVDTTQIAASNVPVQVEVIPSNGGSMSAVGTAAGTSMTMNITGSN